MAATAQITNYTCGLACIESLARNRGTSITQQELINRFQTECKKDGRNEGSITIQNVADILEELKLATAAELGYATKEFIYECVSKIPVGVFIFTTNHPDGTPGGYHCWRLLEVHGWGVMIFEPLLPAGADPVPHTWQQLTLWGCLVLAMTA